MLDPQLIRYPVRYDDFGQKIFDAENNVIADIRSWGRIQYMKDPEKKQEEMGEFIAKAINDAMR